MSINTVKNFISICLKDNNKTMLILLFLALFIRLIYVLFIKQMPITNDDLHYNIIAGNILNGSGFSYEPTEPTASRGPLYPLFLAVSYSVFGFNYNIARILQAIIGAVTCLFIYLIAKRLYNHNIALWVFILAGFYPSLIGYSGLLYSETLAAFLLSSTILFYFLSVKKNSVPLFIITGTFLGSLILCYPKFLFLPIIFGFSIYLFDKCHKQFLKYFFGLMAGVVLIITPWTIRNFNEFGKFIPVATGAGTTLWYSTLAEDNTEWYLDKEPVLSESRKFFHAPLNSFDKHEFFFSIKTNDFFARKAIDNIKNNPLLFLKLSGKRFFRQWAGSNGNSFYTLRGDMASYLLNRNYGVFFIKMFLALFQIFIIVFGILGVFTDISSNRKNILSPVLLAIVYSSIINSIFMTSPRYQIPVLGLLFIYTVLGSHLVYAKFFKIQASA